MLKVALFHDYVNQYGGAERVLEALIELFPSAHIYTLIYSRERSYGRFHRNLHKTSLLDLPLARRNHRPFIPLMPLATRSLTVPDGYDLIISDSAGYAKGIPHPQNTYHLSYCYTPLRYAWETSNYFANPLFKTLFRPAFDYLRKWDFAAAQRPDAFLAVSNFIAGKIRQYYRREADVVYPPVEYGRFYYDPGKQPSTTLPGYYLAAGRLMHYKKFDLVLEAFLELGLPLVIVGVGPEKERLRRRATGAGNIRFLEMVPDDELCSLYNGARAFIFPQVEDFGLVAAEAQACGTPVIAYREGGSLEIVKEGVTGLFFDTQTAASLISAVRRAESLTFDRAKIGSVSRRFTVESFKHGVLSHIPPRILEAAG
jgi:glycosyltransferase involved in cell wall biosynthesis